MIRSKEEFLKDVPDSRNARGFGIINAMETDILAAMEAFANQGRWISVDDRLPEIIPGEYYSKKVPVWNGGFDADCVCNSTLGGNKWFSVDKITHWLDITGPTTNSAT